MNNKRHQRPAEERNVSISLHFIPAHFISSQSIFRQDSIARQSIRPNPSAYYINSLAHSRPSRIIGARHRRRMQTLRARALHLPVLVGFILALLNRRADRLRNYRRRLKSINIGREATAEGFDGAVLLARIIGNYRRRVGRGESIYRDYCE